MARTTTRKPKTAAAEAAPVASAPVIAATPRPAGKLFCVTRSRGSAWDAALAMEQQAEWPAHAAFMDGLERQGFVVVGGPLEDTPYLMLAVRAESLEDARARRNDRRISAVSVGQRPAPFSNGSAGARQHGAPF